MEERGRKCADECKQALPSLFCLDHSFCRVTTWLLSTLVVYIYPFSQPVRTDCVMVSFSAVQSILSSRWGSTPPLHVRLELVLQYKYYVPSFFLLAYPYHHLHDQSPQGCLSAVSCDILLVTSRLGRSWLQVDTRDRNLERGGRDVFWKRGNVCRYQELYHCQLLFLDCGHPLEVSLSPRQLRGWSVLRNNGRLRGRGDMSA